MNCGRWCYLFTICLFNSNMNGIICYTYFYTYTVMFIILCYVIYLYYVILYLLYV